MTKQDHYEGPDFYIIRTKAGGKWWAVSEFYLGCYPATDINEAARVLWCAAEEGGDDIQALLIQSDGSTKVVTSAVVEVAMRKFCEDRYPAVLDWHGADDIAHEFQTNARLDDEHERAYRRP